MIWDKFHIFNMSKPLTPKIDKTKQIKTKQVTVY